MTLKKAYIRLSISILLMVTTIIFYAYGVSKLNLRWSMVGFSIGAILSIFSVILSIHSVSHKRDIKNLNFMTKHRFEFLDWFTFLSISMMSIFMIFMFFLLPSDVSQTSMYPTFEDGDRILIYHYAYEAQKDDIVVIKMTTENYPRVLGVVDDQTYFVKRVVGVPGDLLTFELSYGDYYQILINGEVHKNLYGEIYYIKAYQKEDLEGDLWDGIVPVGQYIVFGDNQDGSQDSRLFGPVYSEDIMGKVIYKMWPLGGIK
ncbi:MAG: signal peptidase I [Acholeplasmataceae bacterium]|nr:signal peptidase I [Acholeplasmataceae bacterium]